MKNINALTKKRFNRVNKFSGKVRLHIFIATIASGFLIYIPFFKENMLAIPITIITAIVLIMNYHNEWISLRIKKGDAKQILIGVVLIIISILLISMLGLKAESSNETELVTMLQNPAMKIQTLIFIVISAPFLEEVLFRGILQEWIQGFVSKVMAVIITAFLFAFPHMITGIALKGAAGVNWIAILPYFVIGLILSGMYAKTNKFSTSYYLHLLNNSFAAIAIIFFA